MKVTGCILRAYGFTLTNPSNSILIILFSVQIGHEENISFMISDYKVVFDQNKFMNTEFGS